MKSRVQIQTLLAEVVAEIDKVAKICLNCGHNRDEHFKGIGNPAIPQGEYCVNDLAGDYPEKFKMNITALAGLQNRQKMLEWVLDQEPTTLQIDDCIMPETIVATFSEHKDGKKIPGGVDLDVKADDLDEPYRSILLGASGRLPIELPAPMSEKLQVVYFAVFPSGSVFRNWQVVEETVFDHLSNEELDSFFRNWLNKELLMELKAKYGGR